MVLLPKVCYRLKASTLSEEECNRIMAPFKKTLKNSLSLAVTLPDSFIHSNRFINLVHLFHRSTTDKVSILQNILSADNQSITKLLLEHRLHSIRLDLNIQHSPLLSSNFSAFSKTNRFRTDFIFRLISFASKLGIAFAKPLPASQNSNVTKHTPIYELFHESPEVYAKNLYLFKKHNISHLSDCLSDDGLFILPFKDIIKKNSIHPPSAIIPVWYHTLINKTSISERSLRLKDIITATHLHYNFDILTAPNDADTPLPIIVSPQKPNVFSYWCAAWDDDSNSPIFGRLFTNSKHHITVQHWIRSVDTSDSAFTPISQKVSLVACSGCSLNNPNKLFKRCNTKPNKRTSHFPCVFNIEHEETVSLKEFHTGALNPSDVNVLRCTYFHISHLIRDSLRPHLSSQTPIVVNASDGLLTRSHPFQYGLFFKHKTEYINPSLLARPLLNTIFEAQCFNKYVNLQRYSFISFLNNNRCIDWLATWSRFKNCSNQPKSHTSFKKSTHIAFASKLMLDELPLLHKLQTTRRPDLYDKDWNCFLCNEDKETWDYLWQCSALKPRLNSLLTCTKQAFEAWIKENSKFRINHLPDSWNNLIVWQYPDPCMASTTFDLMIKGFIPTDLTSELAKYLFKKDIFK